MDLSPLAQCRLVTNTPILSNNQSTMNLAIGTNDHAFYRLQQQTEQTATGRRKIPYSKASDAIAHSF
jgi:hypothetical protein